MGIRVGAHQVTGDGLAWRVTRRALAVLAMERGDVDRDRLAEVVWDGMPPRSWETALRGSISHIRRAVTAHGGANPVRTSPGCYSLAPGVTVDAVLAIALVPAAEHALAAGDGAEALMLAAEAATVLTQAFVAGEEGSWFDDQRRTLDAVARRALLMESSVASELGRHQQAIAAAERVVTLDPFVEAGHQRLIAAHAATGDRAGALVAYRRCRDLLLEAFGIEPSEGTEDVGRVHGAADRRRMEGSGNGSAPGERSGAGAQPESDLR